MQGRHRKDYEQLLGKFSIHKAQLQPFYGKRGSKPSRSNTTVSRRKSAVGRKLELKRPPCATSSEADFLLGEKFSSNPLLLHTFQRLPRTFPAPDFTEWDQQSPQRSLIKGKKVQQLWGKGVRRAEMKVQEATSCLELVQRGW